MRILVIGDPHGDLEKVKTIPLRNIDLILLTGDLGRANLMRKMSFENIKSKRQGLGEKEFSPRQRKQAFMEAYSSSVEVVKYLARFSQVYTIYGNVESSNSETKKESKEIGLSLPYLTDALNNIFGVKVINNKIVNFRGVRIGGLDYFVDTNWVREFKPSNYRERLKSAKKGTDKAKQFLSRSEDLEILICHQSPYGYLDKVTAKFAPRHWKGKHAGSKIIVNYIEKHQPKYVFCGHIHEGEGKAKIGSTQVYNLGVCGYKIIEL